MSFGSASMVSSRVICSRTPPSLMPGESSAPVSSSCTVDWIFTSSRTLSRSMWTVSPVSGWRTSSLSTTGLALPPSMVRSITAPAEARA